MKIGVLLAVLLGAHVVASWLGAVPGHLSVDECTYHLMARAADAGSLAFWNGYEEYPSRELVFVSVEPSNGHLYPVTPALYAGLAWPFYRLLGYPGLLLLNNLAFLGALALTAALALRLFRDRGLAVGAVLVLGLATYFWEYSQGAWPHAVSTLAVVGAFAAAWRGLEACTEPAALGWCLLAGATVGVGTGVRLDVLMAAPCLLVPFAFAHGRRPWASLGVVVGMLPGLVALSFINHLKFDTWSPLSYGPRVSAAGEWLHYLPVAALGLAILAGVRAAMHPGARARLRGSGIRGVAAVGIALAALLAFPEVRELLVRLTRGVGTLVFDLRWFPADAERPALARSATGGLVYFGHLKKAWLQSLPYLGLLVLPCVAMLRGHADRGRLAALCLVPAGYLAAFGYFTWDGGMGLNLRYLTPALPFLAILTAWTLRELWGAGAGAAPWVSGWLGIVVYAVLVRRGDGDSAGAETAVLGVPLILAMACAVSGLTFALQGERAGRVLRTATGAAAGAALTWAALVAFAYDYPAARWLRSYNADLSRLVGPLVRPDSILFTTHPDPFCGLLDTDRVRIALPRRDRFADFRPLVDFHLAAGRPVYGAFPPDLWAKLHRHAWLDGLAVETLQEHPVFVIGEIKEPLPPGQPSRGP
ncbi:MAG: hypothetical protein QF890_06695 [Myxococcota bacterium]|nr:hypothetical protein [Deltaproteobacteria bacterium]MDP6242658.1 hypothetical protein [Myxococcota bacterium]MDP7074247.1 hypothetical protein [Myxococcota bacterium]MDP7432245.1 hypothetical protein [Myxococcota bacterium]HJO25322.1 hypothetical protein [Myxococcota bacterium]